MSQERFTVLMRQFIGNQLTEQDMDELRSLVADGGYEEEMMKLYDEVYDSPNYTSYEKEMPPDRVQKILYAIYNSEKAPAKVILLRRRVGAWWWAAAVLLLLA